MIGFIALAGNIVRNSILLVDFIRHGSTDGRTLPAGFICFDRTGTDADRDVMLKETARSIADSGYSDVALVPWFVMMAKNRKGKEVLLLVDPVSRMNVEIENGPGEAETAAAPEKQIPK